MSLLNRPFFIALLFGSSFTIGLFFVMPLRDDLAFLRGELKKKQFELRTSREYVENLRFLEGKLQQAPEAVAKLNAAIPDAPNLPSLYDFLQKLGATSGLALKSVDGSLKVDGQNPRLNVVSVSMRVAGSYEGLKDFLGRLKSSPRIIRVESVGFSSPAAKNAPFDAHVLLSAYSY